MPRRKENKYKKDVAIIVSYVVLSFLTGTSSSFFALGTVVLSYCLTDQFSSTQCLYQETSVCFLNTSLRQYRYCTLFVQMDGCLLWAVGGGFNTVVVFFLNLGNHFQRYFIKLIEQSVFLRPAQRECGCTFS